MSKFFVGQRVRKVRGKLDIGNTGVIVCFLDGEWNVLVRWDKSGLCVDGLKPAGHEAPTKSELLEPILPEGAAPSEFKTLRDLLNSLEGVHA